MLLFNKSSNPDFLTTNLINSLNRIEKEQVNQRKDLSVINALLKSLIADLGVQKQVDDYFDKEETPPQTDSVEQDDSD